jgi:hypothetical protein
MPRPALGRAFRPVLALLALALPQPLLHAALASAAGTAFEAAPFVLLACFVRSSRVRSLAALTSCGCGALPGALSLPAVALCWLAFGPLAALARLAAGLGALALFPRAWESASEPDPLAELEGIALAAFASAAGCEALRLGNGAVHFGALSGTLAFMAGACIGVLSPCAGAAVATAAGLRGTSWAASAGLLATAGIVPRRFLHAIAPHTVFLAAMSAERGTRRDGRIAYGLLGCACAALIVRGASGFVHPRLLPALVIGAALCLYLATRDLAIRAAPAPRTKASLALPLALLGALVAGSPLPSENIDLTNLADAYPGAALQFTGAAEERGARTVLVRYAITCCRADATPIALLTEHKLRVRNGTWIEASGTIVREGDGARLVLRPENWRAVAPPADPFVYR